MGVDVDVLSEERIEGQRVVTVGIDGEVNNGLMWGQGTPCVIVESDVEGATLGEIFVVDHDKGEKSTLPEARRDFESPESLAPERGRRAGGMG